jgi:Dynamin family
MGPIMTDTELSQFDSRLADMHDQLAQMFRAHGCGTALQHLSSIQWGPADRAKVVVVGAVNAGKTALINAVLDRPDLLPIQPTTTYFAVGAGRPEGVRIHLSDGSVVTDGPQALRDGLDRSIDGAAVEHVEVLLAEPRLAGMTLFDTPGVGGLDGGAGQVTLAALEQATALVFVCSAEAKISIAERDFLTAAARRVDHIVFVGSKVDLLDDLGAENLREDEDAVAGSSRAAKRYADLTFLPFSARIATTARGNPRKLADSGITALREQLDRIAARHAVYGQLNVLRAMKEAITLANEDLHRRNKALDHPAAEAELRRIKEQLNELRQSQTTWRRALLKELDEARDAVNTNHKKRMKALRGDFQQRLATRQKDQIRDYETDLVQALCQLQTDAAADVAGHVAQLVSQLWRRIFADDPDIADLAEKLPVPDETPADYIAERTLPTADIPPWMQAVQGTYLPWMMFKNLAGILGAAGGAATVLGVPVAVAAAPIAVAAAPIGVAWYLLQKRMRDHSADLASLGVWTTSAVDEANDVIGRDISRGFKTASSQLDEVVEQSIGEAIEAVQTAESAQKAAVSDLAIERRHLDALGEELAAPTRQWNILHNELLAVVSAPLPSNSSAKIGQ